MIDDFSIHLSDSLVSFILIAAWTVLLTAAYVDIRKRRIPNSLTITIAVLAICRLAMVGDPIAALYTIGMAVLIFLITAVLFNRGVLGGGDAKLLTAVVLLVGFRNVFSLLVIMGVCGALIAIMMLVLRSRLSALFGANVASLAATTQASIPYGVAIAVGAILAPFFQLFQLSMIR